MSKFVTLEAILGKDQEVLTALKQGEYQTEKLGLLPFSAVDHDEYKQAKKDCLKMVKDGTGGMVPDLDDDKLMIKVIVAAVDKDKRSNFTFADKQLIGKLGVITADQAVATLLSPGEIYNLAMEVQTISGFGAKAKANLEEEVKNS